MSKPRKDAPIKTPRYRGGEEAMKKFLVENLIYPQEAIDHKIEGIVEATYDVDGNGIIRNIKIISSLGFGCDEEVIRLVSLLKFEKAFNKGRNVTAHKKLKVDFKLPETNSKPENKVTYHLVKKKPAATTPAPEEKKDKTITYTINLGGSK